MRKDKKNLTLGGMMILASVLVGFGAYLAAPFVVPSGCTIIKDLSQLGVDWPNLDRYRAQNSELTRQHADKPRVVFFGDSITDFWIARSPAFFRAHGYLDRGIGGQTTPQMLIRFRPDVIDIGASVVVLLAGINDIAGKTGPSTPRMIQDNIMSMVELSRASGIVPILSSLLPANRLGRKEKIDAMNEWFEAYAKSKNLVYVDYHRALVDSDGGFRKDLTDDGVHPNEAGYKLMEPLAEEALARVMARAGKSP